MTDFERLNRLRVVQGMTWNQLAKGLGVSVAMLMLVKSGKRNLGEKPRFRLAKLEREAKLPDALPENVSEPTFADDFAALTTNLAWVRAGSPQFKISVGDIDRGYVVIPLQYKRGTEPPRGYPKEIRMVRPGFKESLKVLRELDATRDPELVLFACLPPEYANINFLDQLTPMCVNMLEEAAFEFTVGRGGKPRMPSKRSGRPAP